MAEYGLTEGEAWTVITQGVNFGMTQLVDGNWGVHAIVPKAIFDVDGNVDTPSLCRRRKLRRGENKKSLRTIPKTN
jgi:hypothetical protein